MCLRESKKRCGRACLNASSWALHFSKLSKLAFPRQIGPATCRFRTSVIKSG